MADTGATDDLGTLFVEPGIPSATVEALRAMGHKVKVERTGIPVGGYQAIARNPVTGVCTGTTEMRKDGQASGCWGRVGQKYWVMASGSHIAGHSHRSPS